MSIVITFYPAKASKRDLKNFIESAGFQPTRFFLDPFPKGTLYYAWHDVADFKSLDGVEVAILKSSDDLSVSEYTENLWYFYSRTRVHASAHDREKQNEITREAKKRFGGKFHNDHGGWNKYTKIGKEEYLTPTESGLFILYERIKRQIDDLLKSLKSVKDLIYLDPEHTDKRVIEMMSTVEPTLALYNSLLPFAVSVIEHFFKETFKILLKYHLDKDEDLHKMKINSLKQLTDLQDIVDIRNGDKTLEDFIADNYSFQNLDHVSNAFKKYLKIDINAILAGVKITRNVTLRDHLIEIIERRHYMIHQFSFSSDFNRDKFIKVLRTCDKVIEVILSEIEKIKDITVRSHSIYFRMSIF